MAASQQSLLFEKLGPGDPAPWFEQASTTNANYTFDTAAGRYIVLCFFGSAADPVGAAALKAVNANRQLFDDAHACFFGVSIDPQDRKQDRVRESLPGLRFFWDFDLVVSRLYGAAPRDDGTGKRTAQKRMFWLILDPTLRIIANIPFAADGSDRARVFEELRGLPPPDRFAGFEVPPPILVLPRVFEPEICQRLIGLYDRQGGTDFGFMREVGGRTVSMVDSTHKRRKDFAIEDEALKLALGGRIIRRVNPEIAKVYAFRPTRMERYIVGCYAADDGGHFRPHRDNTTRGTAHRRFAVSINLNADFEGGEVSFPEYGQRGYKAPPGGAVVFPCALLHAVARVRKGRRYAFLPFLYDEEAAKLREANHQYVTVETEHRARPAPSTPLEEMAGATHLV